MANLHTGMSPADHTSSTSSQNGLGEESNDGELAKQVALAYDQNPDLKSINTLYVAQSGDIITLHGTVKDSQTLEHLVSVAKEVDGVTDVDISLVSIT